MKNPKSKNIKKLTAIRKSMTLSSAADTFRKSREGGATRISALKESVKDYGMKSSAESILQSKRVGGVGDFFKGAGFDNIGEILGAIFDRSATEEEIQQAKKTLGVESPEKKETKEKKESKPKVDNSKFILKKSVDIESKIDSLRDLVSSIDKKLDYISERVSPKIISAKEEGGNSIAVIQYDPLAPSGEQFRSINESGKLSAKKISKKYMKSASMRASLLARAPAAEKNEVSRYKDPKEKSMVIKRDPLLLLKDDMNKNFQKVFDMLDDQKQILESGDFGGAGGGSMLMPSGLGRRSPIGRSTRQPRAGGRPSTPTPRTPTSPTAPSVRTPIPTTGIPGTPTPTPPAGGAAASRSSVLSRAGSAASRKWSLFLQFVKRRSPTLFAKVATRLATAAGMAAVPLAGWIGSLITLGLSVSMAWELYTLWQSFDQNSEIYDELDGLDLKEDQVESIVSYLEENVLTGEFLKDPAALVLVKVNGNAIGFSYPPGPTVAFPGMESEFERQKSASGEINEKYKTKPITTAPRPQDKKETETPNTTEKQKGFFSTGVSAVKSFFGFGGDSKTGEETIPKPKGSTDVLSGGPISIPTNEEDIKKMIIGHEGVRYRPYKDSRGLWTVGVGHLIGDGTTLPPEWDRQFTESEVLGLFEKDYEEHRRAAEKIPGFSKMNIAGKAALTDLTFNMGPAWIKEWPNTAKKLEEGDFEGVASELEQSRWYTQVGNRAPKIVGLMRKAGDDSIAMSEKRGGVIPSQSGTESNAGMTIPSQSGSESNAGMVIPSQSGSESNKGMVIPSQSGSESNKGMVIPSQTAAVAPVPNRIGTQIDGGSRTLDAAKTESKAPVVVNNTTVQQSAPSSPPPPAGGGQLPSAKPRSAESSFGRAIAKDFSHPTAFTTVGTV